MVYAICDYANPKFKLVSAKSETMWIELPFDAIDPIPLTPEILEKAGFARFNEGDDMVWVHDKIFRPIMRGSGNPDGSDQGYYLALSPYDATPITKNMQHLHQLQNAVFALTCEELEVKL